MGETRNEPEKEAHRGREPGDLAPEERDAHPSPVTVGTRREIFIEVNGACSLRTFSLSREPTKNATDMDNLLRHDNRTKTNHSQRRLEATICAAKLTVIRG